MSGLIHYPGIDDVIKKIGNDTAFVDGASSFICANGSTHRNGARAPVPDSPLLNNFHDSTNADHDRKICTTARDSMG